MTTHWLDDSVVHYVWDRAIPPRLEIGSGDTVVLRCRDAADGFYSAASTRADVAKRVLKGHPLSGPIAVRGARPGDVLAIEVLELETGTFGFTAVRPGAGLLAQDFPGPHLELWDLRGSHAVFRPGIRVPLGPFLGVMGVAPLDTGPLPTAPPRRNGGNMDLKQLTVGSTLYLPVDVDGALFSAGDGHAAQGDGEVCGTAIETTMTAVLRFTLRRDRAIPAPQLETPPARARASGGQYATTGISPDLLEAAREAIRAMIVYLVDRRGLSREEAYVLSSVAVDLKIGEVVNAPNWLVSAFLSLDLFPPEMAR